MADMKLIQGDCLEKIKELKDNSIDSIVTDPPYGLAFMNKKWDYDVPSQEIWEQCLRVLKPGGHLLSFAGSRTYHRMAVRIEDAGFEIRDQIMWVYGCLTEDTEILTKEGWKHYHKITKDDIYNKEEILVYDTENDIYKWERPQRWYVYPVNEDTIYRIRGNQTDQLVSRDHNCLVERDGELTFVKSQDLDDMERMPVLSNDFSFLQKGEFQVLQSPMQRDGERRGMETPRTQRSFGMDRRKSQESSNKNEWGEQSVLEGWYNLQEQEGVLLQGKNKIREVPRRIQKYGEERWIRNGIQIESSTGIEETFVEDGMCASHRPQPRKQRHTKSNVIQEQLRPQEIRSGTSYTTDLATITKETYSGIIFCPNTSTGAFVARRNGKIFITGNSGFPKSLNIGKAVDKLQGNKREVVGKNKSGRKRNCMAGADFKGEYNISKGNSEWEGWGTSLKPANEPIVMARKPISEKTIVDNCIKHGTGGINIDESRISTDDNLGGGATKGSVLNIEGFDRPWMHDEYKMKEFGDKMKEKVKHAETLGRFPANIIFDEEAGKLLDEQSGELTSGSKGGASRFFYCAKVSKQDREEGNNHPTVKPTDLMLYLIRLVTPKGGNTLDPFMGSGSTGKAAMRGEFNFVGIEREKEYFDIAKKRIEGAIPEDSPEIEENQKSESFLF